MAVYLQKTSPKDGEILKNMYSLYLHDLSAYSGSLKENNEGTYEFDSFSVFWNKQGVNPYFIIADGERAGFLLLLEPPFTKKVDYIINDFFVYNRFRGKGVARRAAQNLFENKRGSYFVAQLTRNERAAAFWRKVYNQNGIPFDEYEDEEEGEAIICQEFTV
ncbi:GNAT family N-acetyltransferase [Bacillus sp. B-jedd]|uniref:GNAT family N-acetyltransferase n=1 Tax=Bacillus sp. B-jedd TaxID=1476857 RepID=UPI0005156F2E|nr:GNAT family N-acetyltransferase [Bacillus sp. B-jedd]CEG29279.1 acetyltransferase, GNAT family [Bacillus sp. B-jedd]